MLLFFCSYSFATHVLCIVGVTCFHLPSSAANGTTSNAIVSCPVDIGTTVTRPNRLVAILRSGNLYAVQVTGGQRAESLAKQSQRKVP